MKVDKIIKNAKVFTSDKKIFLRRLLQLKTVNLLMLVTIQDLPALKAK